MRFGEKVMCDLQPAEQLKSNHCNTFRVQTGIKMSGEEDGTLRRKLVIGIVDQQNDGVLRQHIKLHRQIIGNREIRPVAADAFAGCFLRIDSAGKVAGEGPLHIVGKIVM